MDSVAILQQQSEPLVDLESPHMRRRPGVSEEERSSEMASSTSSLNDASSTHHSSTLDHSNENGHVVDSSSSSSLQKIQITADSDSDSPRDDGVSTTPTFETLKLDHERKRQKEPEQYAADNGSTSTNQPQEVQDQDSSSPAFMDGDTSSSNMEGVSGSNRNENAATMPDSIDFSQFSSKNSSSSSSTDTITAPFSNSHHITITQDTNDDRDASTDTTRTAHSGGRSTTINSPSSPTAFNSGNASTTSRPNRKRKSMDSTSSSSLATTDNNELLSPQKTNYNNRKRKSIPSVILGSLTRNGSFKNLIGSGKKSSKDKYLVQADNQIELYRSTSAGHLPSMSKSLGRGPDEETTIVLTGTAAEDRFKKDSTSEGLNNQSKGLRPGSGGSSTTQQSTKLKRSLTIDTSVGFNKDSIFSINKKDHQETRSPSPVVVEEEEIVLPPPVPKDSSSDDEDDDDTEQVIYSNRRIESPSSQQSPSRRPKLTLNLPPRSKNKPKTLTRIPASPSDDEKLKDPRVYITDAEPEDSLLPNSSSRGRLASPQHPLSSAGTPPGLQHLRVPSPGDYLHDGSTPSSSSSSALNSGHSHANQLNLPVYSPLSPFQYPDEYGAKFAEQNGEQSLSPLSRTKNQQYQQQVVDPHHANTLHTPTPASEDSESTRSRSRMQISLSPLKTRQNHGMSMSVPDRLDSGSKHSSKNKAARPGLTIVSGRQKSKAIKLPIHRKKSPSSKYTVDTIQSIQSQKSAQDLKSDVLSPDSAKSSNHSMWSARRKKSSPSSVRRYQSKSRRGFKSGRQDGRSYIGETDSVQHTSCAPCSFIFKPARAILNRIFRPKKKHNIIRDIEMVRSLSQADVMSTCSSVSLARTPSVDGLVAYKKYKTTGSEYAKKRVSQEEHIHSRMRHPNIVRLIGKGGDSEQENSLVFEYIDGDNLQAYIQKNYPISLLEIRRIIFEILKAVHYIHRKGCIHGDLKSSNILMQKPENRVKVCDFGAAAHVGHKPYVELDSGKLMMGTPLYSAPESIFADPSGKYKMSKASDIYQIGLILYELVSGRTPHHDIAGDSCSIFDVIMKLRRKYEKGKMLEISEKMCNDKQIIDFFNKCIEVDFRKRPTARELRRHPLFDSLEGTAAEGVELQQSCTRKGITADGKAATFFRPLSRMSSVNSMASSIGGKAWN